MTPAVFWIMIEMLKIGMQTDLSEMMEKLVEYMEIDIDNIMEKIMKVLPQIVYSIVGIVLIFVTIVISTAELSLFNSCNVSNILLAARVAIDMGLSLDQIAKGIKNGLK